MFPNRPLLSESSRHPKMVKTIKAELPIIHAIMHLAPAELSGYNVCPMASAGCKAACLHTSGHHSPRKYAARLWKTRMFFEARDEFMARLVKEIADLERRADREGAIAGVRLNGTSDIPWEKYDIIDRFPGVQFYDYTKRPNRRNLPENYHITFSRDEGNEEQCLRAIRNGINVAVVFRDELPETYKGFPVIDGDLHDWRVDDPHPCIVGLRAKGKAKNDNTGFVI